MFGDGVPLSVTATTVVLTPYADGCLWSSDGRFSHCIFGCCSWQAWLARKLVIKKYLLEDLFWLFDLKGICTYLGKSYTNSKNSILGKDIQYLDRSVTLYFHLFRKRILKYANSDFNFFHSRSSLSKTYAEVKFSANWTTKVFSIIAQSLCGPGQALGLH